MTLIGDNKAALTWADNGKVNSRVCINMNIAACMFVQHTGIIEAKSIQISGQEMGAVDLLSRGDPFLLNEHSNPQLTSEMRRRLDKMDYYNLNSDPIMQDLMPLITPPKANNVKEMKIDERLDNPIEAIIQMLTIIRRIPRRGDWTPRPLPLFNLKEI